MRSAKFPVGAQQQKHFIRGHFTPQTTNRNRSSTALGMAEPDPDRQMSVYSLRCHCGKVTATIKCSSSRLVVWDCNCSDCAIRRNTHFIIPQRNLNIDREHWIDNTILYEWGSKTAQRRFCKTCGILPFYTPRSNPDGYAITLACVDFGNDQQKPTIEVKFFDGEHWEDSFARSSITDQSK